MKSVVYFSAKDVGAARLFLATKKAEGHDAHWANSDEFENPRDVEFVDEVFLVSPAARVEAAYAGRGVKVTRAYENVASKDAPVVEQAPKEAMPEPVQDSAEEPEAGAAMRAGDDIVSKRGPGRPRKASV